MTMTNPTTTTVQTVELPPPGFPMLTRMISDRLFPPDAKSQGEPQGEPEPVTWIVGQAHPLVPDMRVMRMFIDQSVVEVYSVSSDGKAGIRNRVPMHSIRLTEEAMPLDVFVEELIAAEEMVGDEDANLDELETTTSDATSGQNASP
jgi:hypothetical protein